MTTSTLDAEASKKKNKTYQLLGLHSDSTRSPTAMVSGAPVKWNSRSAPSQQDSPDDSMTTWYCLDTVYLPSAKSVAFVGGVS
jgi:hypothetical protein